MTVLKLWKKFIGVGDIDMKKIISIILICVFVFILSSCVSTKKEDFTTFEYFEVLYTEGNFVGDGVFIIYRDTRTDIIYHFYMLERSGGLSVMYNKDGSIMTYEDWCELNGN